MLRLLLHAGGGGTAAAMHDAASQPASQSSADRQAVVAEHWHDNLRRTGRTDVGGALSRRKQHDLSINDARRQRQI